MSEKKTVVKTTFENVVTLLSVLFSEYFTIQNNEINQYARICFTDNFKKDNYKIFKDFAIYYDKVDSFRISIADSTLIDCKVFKATHEKSEKTKELAFTVKSEELISTVYEIVAQRLIQSDKVVYYSKSKEIKTTTKATEKKARKAK